MDSYPAGSAPQRRAASHAGLPNQRHRPCSRRGCLRLPARMEASRRGVIAPKPLQRPPRSLRLSLCVCGGMDGGAAVGQMTVVWDLLPSQLMCANDSPCGR
eukprot:scaffold12212_cov122-Isochrysis_galbana.AAC.2